MTSNMEKLTVPWRFFWSREISGKRKYSLTEIRTWNVLATWATLLENGADAQNDITGKACEWFEDSCSRKLFWKTFFERFSKPLIGVQLRWADPPHGWFGVSCRVSCDASCDASFDALTKGCVYPHQTNKMRRNSGIKPQLVSENSVLRSLWSFEFRVSLLPQLLEISSPTGFVRS